MNARNENKPTEAWLFFDGECPICRRWVERLRAPLSKHHFQFAPQQNEFAQKTLGLKPGEIFPETGDATRNPRRPGDKRPPRVCGTCRFHRLPDTDRSRARSLRTSEIETVDIILLEKEGRAQDHLVLANFDLSQAACVQRSLTWLQFSGSDRLGGCDREVTQIPSVP